MGALELDRQGNHDDPQNGCRSLGSDYFPSGQSRKISIGIIAEDNVKRYGSRKEDEVAVNSTRKGASGQKPVKESNKLPVIEDSLKVKQTENAGQKRSPWISTKSFDHEMPTTRTVEFYATRSTMLKSGDEAQKKFNRINGTPKPKVLEIYSKQSMILQSSDGLKKKFDGITYGRRKETGGSTERVEEFAFAATQEVHVSDKGAGEEKKEKGVDRSSEALKQKLWKALETAPSQNEKNSNSKTVEEEVGAENMNLEQINRSSSRADKFKQNSDTIETDSESPDIETKRPVTRSLTRKKTSTVPLTKLNPKISNGGKSATNVSYGQALQEKNIYTFNEAEERPGSLYRTANTSFARKAVRKNNRVEPRRISFSGKKNLEKSGQGADGGERPLEASKTPSHSSREEKFRSNPSDNNRQHQAINKIRKEEFHHLSESKKANQQEESSSPELPKHSRPQEDLSSGSKKKNAHTQYGSESPTAPMRETINTSYVNPLYNLRTLQKRSGFKALSDSDDSEDLKDSPIKESSPVMEKIHAKHKFSQSSEDQEVESLEEDQLIKKGCRNKEMWTAGFDKPEKSRVNIPPSKKRRGDGLTTVAPTQKGSDKHEKSRVIRPSKRRRRSELKDVSPTQNGTEDINELEQPDDQNHEDGLTRTVAVFASALENFKTKMHTGTNKKSSEILASVAEEIQLQLQNTNSQINRDVLKFTNLSKSKRKSLETRFQ
ncbi:Asynaptic protein, partial [Thalictrum thalictroides]